MAIFFISHPILLRGRCISARVPSVKTHHGIKVYCEQIVQCLYIPFLINFPDFAMITDAVAWSLNHGYVTEYKKVSWYQQKDKVQGV